MNFSVLERNVIIVSSEKLINFQYTVNVPYVRKKMQSQILQNSFAIGLLRLIFMFLCIITYCTICDIVLL